MISSRQNQFIKAIRKLRHSKGDVALLEGVNLVEEAVGSGIPLQWALVTAEFLAGAQGARLVERLPPSLVHQTTAEALSAVADVDSPQGIVAAATLPRRGVEALPVVRGGCVLFLDRIQDPGNLGAIARVAEAAGVDGIGLSPGTAHPNHPRSLRASAGSLLRVAVAVECGISEILAHLEATNPTVLALDTAGDDLYTTDLSGSVVLLVGNEGRGLGPEASGAAQRRIAIPMERPVESLNVAVATALALFERRRRVS